MSDNDMQDAVPACSRGCDPDEFPVIFQHEGEPYCAQHRDRLFRMCDRCGEYEARRSCHYVSVGYNDEEMWCDHCTDYYSYYCDSCDITHDGDHECQYGRALNLDEYSYKPVPIFHGSSPEHLYFGAEIEMESECGEGEAALDYLRDRLGDQAYYKSDGSLCSEDAFEMVTHPRTLASWQSWLPRLQETMQRVRGLGMRSWNTETCGIHIHIDSRAFASSAHLYRFAQIIYRNPMEMQRLAGRGSNHYASYDIDGRRVAESIKARKRYGGGGDRYLAVNMQNSTTVEVRMFRGSLKPERLLADIELLHALVTYTRDMTVRDAYSGGLTFPVFAFYVKANREMYPNLVALMTRDFDMAQA